MTTRQVYYLSIPVLDLTSARDFYVNILGARVGRESDQWLDILLWGHHRRERGSVGFREKRAR